MRIRKSHMGHYVAVISIAFLLAYVSNSIVVSQPRTRYYDQLIIFRAADTIISMPYPMSALIFDTTVSYHGIDSVPDWQLIGNYRIERIAYIDTTMLLTSQAQAAGVKISDSLVSMLNIIFPHMLIKEFPRFNRADTLYWDTIREQWVHLPDLSRYWEIRYKNELPTDSVAELFRSIPGISNPHKMEMPATDSGGITIWPDGYRE